MIHVLDINCLYHVSTNIQHQIIFSGVFKMDSDITTWLMKMPGVKRDALHT